jgi:hypothetical protein
LNGGNPTQTTQNVPFLPGFGFGSFTGLRA